MLKESMSSVSRCYCCCCLHYILSVVSLYFLACMHSFNLHFRLNDHTCINP